MGTYKIEGAPSNFMHMRIGVFLKIKIYNVAQVV
jgi:hypothetical protein